MFVYAIGSPWLSNRNLAADSCSISRRLFPRADHRTVLTAVMTVATRAAIRSFPRILDTRRQPSAEYGNARSEEHTSELQSPYDLVCRLLLEKKKNILINITYHALINLFFLLRPT